MLIVILILLIAALFGCFSSRKFNITSVCFTAIAAVFSLFTFRNFQLLEISNLSIFSSKMLLKLLPISSSYEIFFFLRHDALSTIWCFTISLLAAFTCLYSIGYLRYSVGKFLAYNNLFAASMIFFVCSNNLLQLYFGWELITLISYLFINFYHLNKENYKNIAFKIFALHRFGDVFFLLGIATIYYFYGTFEFVKPKQIDKIYGMYPSDIAVFFIFLSIAIKSAQLGFMSWLRDAMIAPTPASAFLHAATLVSAGVVVLIRLTSMFELCPILQHIIIIYGVMSSILGAICALREYDLKKILAYSTCSKVGIMIAACGAGNYTAAVIYFIVHAFIKCSLFFCAGNIANALSNEGDIRNMGGLMTSLPKTYIATISATLMFVGIFFVIVDAKDVFMASNLNMNLKYIFGFCMFVTGLLTFLYMIRLIYLIFHGDSKVDERAFGYINENNKILLVCNWALIFINIIIRCGMLVLSYNVWIKSDDKLVSYIINMASFIMCIFLYKNGCVDKFINYVCSFKGFKFNFISFEQCNSLCSLSHFLDTTLFRKFYVGISNCSKKLVVLLRSDVISIIMGNILLLAVVFHFVRNFK